MSTETRRHLGHLARGGALGVVGAAVSAVGGFGLVALITNGFDPTAAGIVFTASSLFVIVLSLSQLGTDVGLGRFVLRYAAESRSDAIRACLRTAFRAVLIISASIAIILGFAAPALADLMGLDGPSGGPVLRAFAVALPVSAAGAVALAATRAFGDIRPTVIVDQFGRSLAQPLLVLTVMVTGTGVVALSAAWVLPYALIGAIGCLLLHHVLRRKAPRDPLTFDADMDRAAVTREFWVFTWPRSLGSVSQMVIQRADIIIIAALMTPADAAVYTAATRFVVLGKLGIQAIQQVLQPQITHLLATRQLQVLSNVFKTSAAWSVAVAWPIYLVIGCAPAVYLSLFGSEFAERGASTVVIMMAGMLIAIFCGPVDTMLLMAGRSTASLINSLIALVVNLGLCFLLIPRMGIVGAAVAWAACLIVRNLLAYAQVHSSLKLSPTSPASLIAAAAATLCFGAPMLTIWLTDNDSLITFLTVGVIGSFCYVGALWLGRKPLRLHVLRDMTKRRAPAMAAK